MHFEARIEPLTGKLPKVSYRWDPETDILSVACKGTGKTTGLNGTVDLEGGDGSFVVIDVAGGCIHGVDVVTWPDANAPPPSCVSPTCCSSRWTRTRGWRGCGFSTCRRSRMWKRQPEQREVLKDGGGGWRLVEVEKAVEEPIERQNGKAG